MVGAFSIIFERNVYGIAFCLVFNDDSKTIVFIFSIIVNTILKFYTLAAVVDYVP